MLCFLVIDCFTYKKRTIVSFGDRMFWGTWSWFCVIYSNMVYESITWQARHIVMVEPKSSILLVSESLVTIGMSFQQSWVCYHDWFQQTYLLHYREPNFDGLCVFGLCVLVLWRKRSINLKHDHLLITATAYCIIKSQTENKRLRAKRKNRGYTRFSYSRDTQLCLLENLNMCYKQRHHLCL